VGWIKQKSGRVARAVGVKALFTQILINIAKLLDF
jgi:hypothetical protein